MLKGRYNGTWSSKMADGWHEYEYGRDDGFPSRDHGEIKEILRDLRIFGKYASCFERFFLGKKLTLESHQTIWAICRSYSSHFSVKTVQRWGDYSVSSSILLTSNIKASQFVPAQQYSNTQRMIDCASKRHRPFHVLGLHRSLRAKFWNRSWIIWARHSGKNLSHEFSHGMLPFTLILRN